MLFGRDERLATFSIGEYRTLTIYAEPEFFYDPPGYLYFELQQWGQVMVPRRRFMGIGSERKPSYGFDLLTADNAEVIALLAGNDVVMMHEFSSGYTWPGPYTNITDAQYEMAEVLLQRLRKVKPEIFCSGQDRYRNEVARRKSKQ